MIFDNSQHLKNLPGRLEDMQNNVLPPHETHENDNPIPHPDPSNDIDGELNFSAYLLVPNKTLNSLFLTLAMSKREIRCVL